MSNAGYNQSFNEIANHEAWIGFVPIKVAVEAISKTEHNFVLSGGVRNNHYLLTCKTTSGKVVLHHVRYDLIHGGWKNCVALTYDNLDSLIHDHLEQGVLSVPA